MIIFYFFATFFDYEENSSKTRRFYETRHLLVSVFELLVVIGLLRICSKVYYYNFVYVYLQLLLCGVHHCEMLSTVVRFSRNRSVMHLRSVTSLQQGKFEKLPQSKKFRLDLGDDCATIEYSCDGETYDLIHTLVPERYGGRGIGSLIAQVCRYHNNERCHITTFHVNCRICENLFSNVQC